MPLTPDQRQQLQDALTAAFNEDELRQMLSLRMGVDLDRIVAHGPLDSRVFELIRWAERREREAELMAAAQNYQAEHGGQGAANPQAAATAPQPTAQNAPKPADPPPPTPKPHAARKSFPPWLGALIIAVIGGVILLFIEYTWFANDGDDPSPPDATVTATAAATPAASPSPAPPTPTPQAPPASSAGVQTLDIAYGDSKQAQLDGVSALVSVPADPNPYLWMGAPESVQVVVIANGAQASGRLKIGECLLAGDMTVTLLDTQGGAKTFNRFALAWVAAGSAPPACVNNPSETN